MARSKFFKNAAQAQKVVQIPYQKPIYSFNTDLVSGESHTINEIVLGFLGINIPETITRITIFNNSGNTIYWNCNGEANATSFPIVNNGSILLEGLYDDILSSEFYCSTNSNIGIILERPQE